jgi:four helix bundle protein
MIKDILDLDVYKDSLKILVHTYGLLKSAPYSERDTVNQLQRACKSIAANIAEGFGKKVYPKEFKRYLMISMASSDECVTHLRSLYITVPAIREKVIHLANEYKILSKRINKLRTSWLSD